MLDNPTKEEVLRAIDAYNPQSVLEIGCGYGRILEWIEHSYPEVHGCDISDDMMTLALERVECPIFFWNIADSKERPNRTWDVSFTRGVFMYLDEAQMAVAMEAVAAITNMGVIIWEWDYVIEQMQEVSAGKDYAEKYDYIEIARNGE